MHSNPTAAATGGRLRSLCCGLALLLLGGVTGCGDDRPAMVPVSGIVTIDGEPMTYGFIRMVREEGGRAATGTIGPDGKFEMLTYEKGDGVVPGTYGIEIAVSEPLSDTKTKWHAPKEYASRKTSGLRETIDKGTNNLEIRLTWGGGKPFVETH